MSQTCALTGTIYGLNDAVLANAVVVFTLMGPDNCKITATNILVDRTPLSALTNGSGVFSQNVVQNSAITPSGTYYRVTCKSANFVKYITAAGATIDVLAAADVVAADQVFSDVDDPDLYWLSFVNSQTLTAGQKLIANTNLGINLTASQLLGQASSGGTGLPVAITLGSNLSMSGTTLNASDTTGTTIADDAIWTAAGQLAYGTGTATGAVLAAGGTTDILVGGGAAAPVWTTATGSGAPVRATSPTLVTPVLGVATATSINGITMESLVAGPASATDNAIVRFDGTTGKLVQDSLWSINGSGRLSSSYEEADIATFGDHSPFITTGLGSYITTSGENGYIATTGLNAHISTGHSSAYIQSRSTFKLYNGTFTTTLAHAPSADYTVTLVPTGSVTMTLPNTSFAAARTDAAQTFTGVQTMTSAALTDAQNTVTTPTTTSVGYLGFPQNSKSANYTTVMADAGKHILHPSSDDNARTFTIASHANVAYPIGTVIKFVNLANLLTIEIAADTLTYIPAGSTGTIQVSSPGEATALKVGNTDWVIWGSNVTPP